MRLTDDLALAADADLVELDSATKFQFEIMRHVQVFIAVRSNEYTQVVFIPLNHHKPAHTLTCMSISNVCVQVLSALHGHIKPSCMVVSLVSGQVTVVL